MRNFVAVVLICVCSTGHLTAQIANDAIRYSYFNIQGTARGTAVGSAMGALGGDFTALSINPAGIGGYWKSEVMVTPAFLHSRTTSSLEGNPSQEEQVNSFNLPNMGVVFANQPKRSAWKSVGFALGMNKMNAYPEEFVFRGESIGSITDRFAGLAYLRRPDELDPFEAGPAYETGAIYDFDENLVYETDFDMSRETPFEKEQLVRTSGHYNEMVINFGGNYQDKLLIGGTVGIPFISYESEKLYNEDDRSDRIPAFDYLQFDEFLTTEGSGVNGKIGVIYKVDHSLRFGLAAHTPTWLTLTDRHYTNMRYDYTDNNGSESFTSFSPDGEFEYGLRTPWRAVGSAAYIFGKSGFITADVEFVDYGSSRFNFTRNSDNPADRDYEEQVNTEIDETYGGSINVRVGAELALQAFRLRGGAQLLQSPFQDDNGMHAIFSAGAGIRGNKAYCDIAYQINTGDEIYIPYLVSDAPQQIVNNSYFRGQLMLTVGFKI